MLSALTTLPVTHQSGSEKLTALHGCPAANEDRVLVQKVIEFGHKLEKISESQEASVNSPRRAGSRFVILNEDYIQIDGTLAKMGVCIEAPNSRIG